MCVSVINLKGGGKTTIAALPGRNAVVSLGLDVLAIDLDPQAHDGGPEKQIALRDIMMKTTKNGWELFRNEIPHSRGFPKQMRGDYSYPGNSVVFREFANEFYKRLGLVPQD